MCGRIILKLILQKWDGGTRTGLIWFTIGCWVGSCEGGDEPLISITCREFLVYMRTSGRILLWYE
jgi:hypothetical protein